MRQEAINILENTLQPAVNQAIIDSILGKEALTTTLTTETTVALNFADAAFHVLQLADANITLTAVVAGMKDGEVVILKIIQDDTTVRTVTFSTGFTMPFGVQINGELDAGDYFLGVIDSGAIIVFPLTRSNNGIIAAAGSDETDATAILNLETVVTAGDDTKGVILPAVADNLIIVVHHVVADKALKIYPAAGEKINGGSADADVIITSAASDTATMRFVKKAAGDWYGVAIRGTLST